jgi:hypothetical protein
MKQQALRLGFTTLASAALALLSSTAHAVKIDFNNDGKADILWHNFASGDTQQWFMSGTARIGYAQLPYSLNVSDANWRLVGEADFDTNGKIDLLWHNGATGETQIWFMDGTSRVGLSQLPASLNVADSSGWTIVGTGDFNNDGKQDILWHNGTSGDTQVWYMSRDVRIGYEQTNPGLRVTDDTAWRAVGVSDFNGDGKQDILWHNGMNGTSQVWFMDHMTRTDYANLDMSLNVADGTFWQVAGTDDFNNDNKPDILWHNANSGATQIWFMNGTTRTSAADLPSSLNTADLSGWRIANGSNLARLAVPLPVPAAPTQLQVTGSDASWLKYSFKDNNQRTILGLGIEVWEVTSAHPDGVMRSNDSPIGQIGGTMTGQESLPYLTNGKNACIKIRAFNAGGISMFSNIACGGSGSMPMATANVGLGNGVFICTADHLDCSFSPRVGQSFDVGWSVCNNGGAASPSLNIKLLQTDNLAQVTSQSFSAVVPAGGCVPQFSGAKTITTQGTFHWDVTINGLPMGGIGNFFLPAQ